MATPAACRTLPATPRRAVRSMYQRPPSRTPTSAPPTPGNGREPEGTAAARRTAPGRGLDEHVAADGGVPSVEDRPRLQEGLGGPEERFPEEEPLILQGRLGRGQVRVGSQHERAVEAGIRFDLGAVDPDGALVDAQEAPVAPLAHRAAAFSLPAPCARLAGPRLPRGPLGITQNRLRHSGRSTGDMACVCRPLERSPEGPPRCPGSPQRPSSATLRMGGAAGFAVGRYPGGGGCGTLGRCPPARAQRATCPPPHRPCGERSRGMRPPPNRQALPSTAAEPARRSPTAPAPRSPGRRARPARPPPRRRGPPGPARTTGSRPRPCRAKAPPARRGPAP
jgi:hypothetical protein